MDMIMEKREIGWEDGLVTAETWKETSWCYPGTLEAVHVCLLACTVQLS